MDKLIEEVIEDFDWRLAELSTIKTLPYRYSINEHHKEFLIKYSVPMIYSIWEGFVKTTFSKYLVCVKNLRLNMDSLHMNYLVHSIDSVCQLSDGRTSFATKSTMITKLFNTIDGEVTVSTAVPTRSNVNYKVLKQILETFNFDGIDEKYKIPLNKLLFFRNKISHGENSIVVNSTDIFAFCQLVEDLIVDVIVLLEKGLVDKCYKK